MFKTIVNMFQNRIKSSSDNIAVARWCIQQFCTCPHCKKEFDIIQENLRTNRNQGTIKITQKVINRYDKDKFEYEEINAEIPTPPYFGAMMENTENLDERINCPTCRKQIVIHEANWRYGR